MGAKQAKANTKNRNVTFKIDEQMNPDEILFSKFAQANFNPSITNEFTKQVLDESILRLNTPGDQIAALAVWISVLRFMGDLPDEQVNVIQVENFIFLLNR